MVTTRRGDSSGSLDNGPFVGVGIVNSQLAHGSKTILIARHDGASDDHQFTVTVTHPGKKRRFSIPDYNSGSTLQLLNEPCHGPRMAISLVVRRQLSEGNLPGIHDPQVTIDLGFTRGTTIDIDLVGSSNISSTEEFTVGRHAGVGGKSRPIARSKVVEL